MCTITLNNTNIKLTLKYKCISETPRTVYQHAQQFPIIKAHLRVFGETRRDGCNDMQISSANVTLA